MRAGEIPLKRFYLGMGPSRTRTRRPADSQGFLPTRTDPQPAPQPAREKKLRKIKGYLICFKNYSQKHDIWTENVKYKNMFQIQSFSTARKIRDFSTRMSYMCKFFANSPFILWPDWPATRIFKLAPTRTRTCSTRTRPDPQKPDSDPSLLLSDANALHFKVLPNFLTLFTHRGNCPCAGSLSGLPCWLSPNFFTNTAAFQPGKNLSKSSVSSKFYFEIHSSAIWQSLIYPPYFFSQF